MGGRLGELERRKYGKPGGHGGRCEMSVINRVHTIIYRGQCAEEWESFRGKNLQSIKTMEASVKEY